MDVVTAVIYLAVAFGLGFLARGYLDRLMVQEMVRRKLIGEQNVKVNWNPVVELRGYREHDVADDA